MSQSHQDLNMHPSSSRVERLRKRTYQILELEQYGLAKFINKLLMFVIAITLVVVFIESVPNIRQNYTLWFAWFEIISITLFTIEYIARVWSAAEINPLHPWHSRWHYIISPLAIIDLLAILPFYLGLFIQIDTRYLRAVRLLRVLKLTRYSSSLTTLLQVLKNEYPAIISALGILLMLIILASSGMYLVERDAQPENFGSIPMTLWWATITLTTVGYGDVVPITFEGKALGMVITILGVGIAALPAGIIASGFTKERQNRRDEFRAKVITAYSDDGILSHDELREIEHLRIQLGLSVNESKALIRLSGAGHASSTFKFCPHCGESLTTQPPAE
ncbi:MAG: ion transporter [Gammaproteobacteria bacterium]|nr:MAG: ion transporter [Gammaproteobacteria bacterium]